MEWSGYPAALREAQRQLHRIGCASVDGRDAHDFAIEAVMQHPWQKNRIRFDVIDALRRETGRKGTRSMVHGFDFERMPSPHFVRFDEDWLDGYWFLTERQREMAVFLSFGVPKLWVARWLDLSPSTLTKATDRIAARIEKHMPFKSKAQRGWMYANEPEMAKRWEKETPKGKKLPGKVEEKKWKRK
jgi:hypothetical protein